MNIEDKMVNVLSNFIFCRFRLQSNGNDSLNPIWFENRMIYSWVTVPKDQRSKLSFRKDHISWEVFVCRFLIHNFIVITRIYINKPSQWGHSPLQTSQSLPPLMKHSSWLSWWSHLEATKGQEQYLSWSGAYSHFCLFISIQSTSKLHFKAQNNSFWLTNLADFWLEYDFFYFAWNF